MRARRLLSTIAAAATIVLSLTSCAGADTGSKATGDGEAYGIKVGAEGTAKGIPGLDDGTAVRVIEDADYKPVAVPKNPKRVVTLSEPTLDGALALNVKPVGSVNGRGQSTLPNYLLDLANGIPSVGTVAQFNFEAIAQLKPDLILTYASGGNNAESVKIMEQIAPVYFVGYAGADWRETFKNTANALNKSSEADAKLKEFDTHANGVKEKLYAAGFADKTVAIVRWQGANASLILKELPPGMALEAVGLKRPPSQDRAGRGHSDPVSLENLSEIDADYMFFGTLGGSSVNNPNAGGSADLSGAQAALAEAERTPGFRALKAYKDHHIILVDGSLWTSTGGPILMQRIVDFLEKALLEKH